MADPELTREQSQRLLDILNSITLFDTPDGRDLLLDGLPPSFSATLPRSTTKTVDLSKMITAAKAWGSTDDGEPALLVLIDNAILRCKGSAAAQQLQTLYDELTVPAPASATAPLRQEPTNSSLPSVSSRAVRTQPGRSRQNPKVVVARSLVSLQRPATTSWTRPLLFLFDFILPVRTQRWDNCVRWYRHWWFLFRVAVWPIVLLVLAMILIPDAPAHFYGTISLFSLRILTWVIAVASILLILFIWHGNYYELRANEIVHHSRHLFDVSLGWKANLSRIICKLEPRSPLGSLLNFGDVTIKIKEGYGNMCVQGVSDPEAVFEEIQYAVDQARQNEQIY